MTLCREGSAQGVGARLYRRTAVHFASAWLEGEDGPSATGAGDTPSLALSAALDRLEVRLGAEPSLAARVRSARHAVLARLCFGR